MKIFIYLLLFILFFIKITCIKDDNVDNFNNYEPIEMYSIDGVPYYVADIGALIISNKSSENINVRFLKLGITNIDIITNGYYLRYFDGIIERYDAPHSRKRLKEFTQTLILKR